MRKTISPLTFADAIAIVADAGHDELAARLDRIESLREARCALRSARRWLASGEPVWAITDLQTAEWWRERARRCFR